MAAPKFDRDKALRILVDALTLGDRTACDKHKISQKTLYRYRTRLKDDPELSAAVQHKKEQTDLEWDSQRREFLMEGFSKLRQLIQDAKLENMRDLVGALKVAGELQITTQALNVKSGTDNQGSSAPVNSGEAASGTGQRADAAD